MTSGSVSPPPFLGLPSSSMYTTRTRFTFAQHVEDFTLALLMPTMGSQRIALAVTVSEPEARTPRVFEHDAEIPWPKDAHLALHDLRHNLSGIHAIEAHNVPKYVPAVTIPAPVSILLTSARRCDGNIRLGVP